MQMNNSKLALRTALLAAASFASAAALPQTPSSMPLYQVLDIGTLGGNETRAVDINDVGEVTGTSDTATGWRHAFIYKDGEMVDLGTLRTDGGGDSSGAAINNKGDVAGEAATGDGAYHAVRYSNGTVADIGTLGGPFSRGYAINEAGQVTGIAYLPEVSLYHAFLYSDVGGLQDLGALGDSYSTGDSINDAGDVAGIYQHQFDTHAYIYRRGALIDLVPGVSSFLRSSRVTLNSAGHVTGTFRAGATTRSFLYRDGAIVDLGSLGGGSTFASALNDADQITGDSTVTPEGGSHAFRWSADTMEDLGTLGGDFSNGVAINAAGVVTGQSVTADRAYHPFVYTNGAMIDLGLPARGVQGFGNAINAVGQVTGTYQVPSGDRFQPFYMRGFVATPIKLLFSKLEDRARAAGLGAIVRITVGVAAWYYSRSDARSTCAALTAVEIETTWLSRHRPQLSGLTRFIADTRALKSTLNCDAGSNTQAESSSNASSDTDSAFAQKAFDSAESERAQQWYRERFGIDANGLLVEGRLRIN
jgi:probable HAF family extracellular repeat protein